MFTPGGAGDSGDDNRENFKKKAAELERLKREAEERQRQLREKSDGKIPEALSGLSMTRSGASTSSHKL